MKKKVKSSKSKKTSKPKNKDSKKKNTKSPLTKENREKIREKMKKNNSIHHILFQQNLTFGQKAADIMTLWAGSWTFIITLLIAMAAWMFVNVYFIFIRWDPYPFILLNFVLSTLAALQAPIILMSQNRQTERDRVALQYDYKVNRQAEREIRKVKKELESIHRKLNEALK